MLSKQIIILIIAAVVLYVLYYFYTRIKDLNILVAKLYNEKSSNNVENPVIKTKFTLPNKQHDDTPVYTITYQSDATKHGNLSMEEYSEMSDRKIKKIRRSNNNNYLLYNSAEDECESFTSNTSAKKSNNRFSASDPIKSTLSGSTSNKFQASSAEFDKIIDNLQQSEVESDFSPNTKHPHNHKLNINVVKSITESIQRADNSNSTNSLSDFVD